VAEVGLAREQLSVDPDVAGFDRGALGVRDHRQQFGAVDPREDVPRDQGAAQNRHGE
jgi:hypothetical protein